MKNYLSILFLLVTTLSFSQDLQPSEMLRQKGHILKSTANGKTYQLYVSLPVGYSSDDSIHYPVLYILDAHYSYPLISSVHELLDYSGEIENIIIVAIGDEDQSLPVWMAGRTADYTPSSDPNADAEIAGGANIALSKVKSGGAKAFLATIRTDIIPFIDNRYKATKDRGIAGHSLGGLFAGYCLLNAPDLFKRFGMNSPSLLWNDEEIVAAEKAFAAKHPDLDAKVFISAGSLEPGVMFPPINAFTTALKEHNYKGLSLTYQLFDNETHTSVMAASTTRMLRVLYGSKRE